ncbi:uncharacterized protein B0H18DRAFT_960646 [Fomitopsis serialis]|uniref:uncharacterized protein n=1 Tax=Fomitopsis serialis TaxID=139415 RepID=UPI002007ED61|nr:uncharacterized protein B0H18DRAFT_960646 [Neoantrodia serialis]KAH9913035.1 hypothetical protein B0H18DRAFT_960646 [Neoantrodia serialis]
MPTPRNVDERLFKIFALTVTTTLDEVWSTSRPCNFCDKMDHVTVVCLERDNFGMLFDYCLMDGTDVCPMELSSTQIDTEDRELMVEAANQPHDPPLKFGGWVLMGAVPECYEDWKRSRPLLNYQWPPYVAETQGPQGRAALVDILFYVEDALLPVSIPLIGIIEPTGFAINIPGPEEQPLLVQAIPGLNPFKNPRPPTPSYDLYNAASQTDYDVVMTKYVRSYATGRKTMEPMSSLKYNFIGLDFIWPVGLPNHRQYKEDTCQSALLPLRLSTGVPAQPEEDEFVVRTPGVAQTKEVNLEKEDEAMDLDIEGMSDEDAELEGEPLWELDSDGY